MKALRIAACALCTLAGAKNLQAENNSGNIITIGGAATEIVYALGFGDRVVGRDHGSHYPKEVMKVPALSFKHGQRINIEAIMKLEPSTIVLCDPRGAYKKIRQQAEAAGIDIVSVYIKTSVEETYEGIRTIARHFKAEKRGEGLIQTIKSDLKKVDNYVKTKKSAPTGMFIYARGMGTMFVAGEGTNAETMFSLTGTKPAVTGFKDFKPVSAEKVAAAAPEKVVLFHDGLKSIGGLKNIKKVPGLKLTPAARNNGIVAVSSNAFLFTPRVGKFALELAKKIHGDLPPTQKVN